MKRKGRNAAQIRGLRVFLDGQRKLFAPRFARGDAVVTAWCQRGDGCYEMPKECLVVTERGRSGDGVVTGGDVLNMVGLEVTGVKGETQSNNPTNKWG